MGFKKESAEIRFPSKTTASAPGQPTDDSYSNTDYRKDNKYQIHV